MHRMNGKHKCRKERRARTTEKPEAAALEKKYVQKVKQKIGAVQRRRIHPPKRDIQHIADPYQRLPGGCMNGGQRPTQSLSGQTLRNHAVLVYV